MPSPIQLSPRPKGQSRSTSTGSVQRPFERFDTGIDLASRSHPSSRSEDTEIPSRADKPTGLNIAARPGYDRAASSSDLRGGLASPVIPKGAVEALIASLHADNPSPIIVTTCYAGLSHKRFNIHREVLLVKVPYFRRLTMDNPLPNEELLTFEDIDEYAFALFVRWLYNGRLHGPNDFHTMQHYLGLYVLAHRFDIEVLCNNVMDLCRAYYRRESMTAPAYRIEYIYAKTSVPNHMRNFLVTTAAYRCLCDAPIAPGVHISNSTKDVLRKGGDLAVDFDEALIKLSLNGIVDVRKGPDCTFHEHSDGKVCEKVVREPWVME